MLEGRRCRSDLSPVKRQEKRGPPGHSVVVEDERTFQGYRAAVAKRKVR